MWWAEAMPLFIVFGALVLTFRKFRFSDTAYVWQYAVIEGGNADVEFLGSQGDIWDAQKDMLVDTLRAITSLVFYVFMRPDKKFQSA
ncbi:DUF2238 domain-containing protein [Kingella kingae]|uniref:DUF2238 domain-containing protein n=2 Tax=Kingella kingae TaxID=504 RepID=UPI0002E60945|nr:DUF2238 domain-containing protein [Kingella kingae]MDK4568697.1 DUF2238 domain-containing protein [Kingella kingae]MDK4570608.1 DUF2238 domain-containing protein [Kingella kingae]MDK4572534.1 DUF2238 domain-containing protein [Kingella kingae]MDK4575951.1 DUF2238 domain-containing protein [Kingella kingae]MDK4581795.1 DUF2238 domain-containing protein [Kingella kingae]